MAQYNSENIHEHTHIITWIIVLAFLLLAAGEYYLYRQQVHLNRMISEGIIQLKEQKINKK